MKNSAQISREVGLPYQTVQDLKNGKSKLTEAKFKMSIKLFNYQKGLDRINELKNKVVKVENPNNIVEYELLSRYYIDIINN
ncbi:hypothetical protein SAGN_00790 [Staphylococcus agnetis]|nr:hypothetical protein SAGN_00790 [Staphylococcus agnetis]